MNLPPLKAATAAMVHVAQLRDVEGRLHFVTVIKQRFAFRDGRTWRCEGAALEPVEVPWDEADPLGSPRVPSDLCLRKPSTDVLLAGRAVASGKREVLTRLSVGPVSAAVRVTGARVYARGALRVDVTSPEPFETLTVRWEEAFGGSVVSEDGSRSAVEARNPVGRGVCTDPDELIETAAPRLEPIDAPIRRAGEGTPIGYGPIPSWFEPRRSLFGTFDQAWQDTQMPLLPTDFDERANQAAPPAMVTPDYLVGGEPVELFNLGAEGLIRFPLPKLSFFVGARTPFGMEPHRTRLDTVFVDADAQTLDLTWRAPIPVPTRHRDLLAIQVHERRVLS